MRITFGGYIARSQFLHVRSHRIIPAKFDCFIRLEAGGYTKTKGADPTELPRDTWVPMRLAYLVVLPQLLVKAYATAPYQHQLL